MIGPPGCGTNCATCVGIWWPRTGREANGKGVQSRAGEKSRSRAQDRHAWRRITLARVTTAQTSGPMTVRPLPSRRARAVGVGLRADADVVFQDRVAFAAALLLLGDRVARRIGAARLPRRRAGRRTGCSRPTSRTSATRMSLRRMAGSFRPSHALSPRRARGAHAAAHT